MGACIETEVRDYSGESPSLKREHETGIKTRHPALCVVWLVRPLKVMTFLDGPHSSVISHSHEISLTQ